MECPVKPYARAVALCDGAHLVPISWPASISEQGNYPETSRSWLRPTCVQPYLLLVLPGLNDSGSWVLFWVDSWEALPCFVFCFHGGLTQMGPMTRRMGPPAMPILWETQQARYIDATSGICRDRGSENWGIGDEPDGRMSGLVGDLCVKLHLWCNKVTGYTPVLQRTLRVVCVGLPLPSRERLVRLATPILHEPAQLCYGGLFTETRLQR